MRNNRKERNAFHSPSYWQSYSDMMAALLLIFILIIAITLAIYKQKQTDLEVTQQQLSSTQADLAMSEEEPKNYMAQLDDANTKVSMTQEELQAAYNAIAAKQEEVDEEKVPSFLKMAGTFKGQVRQRPTGQAGTAITHHAAKEKPPRMTPRRLCSNTYFI